ncbi:BamA/TamA family outer membrane protein [Draconibacterium sp.]|nr:BamA/TamA family outer membrane protein [Draconibacterium sp.]
MSVIAQENLIIRQVKVKGNKHFSSSKLKEQITLESSYWIKEKIFKKEPVYFTEKLYNDDVNRLKIFYQKEGYLNVTFEKPELLVNKKGKVEITIYIKEGEPVIVSEISYLVDSTYLLGDVLRKRDEKKVLFKTEAAKAKIFRDEAIINDKLLIAEAFYDQGYPYTLVKQKLDVDTATNSTKVNWFIDRGPIAYFGSTSVNGNNRVPSKNILRQRAYKEGDIWSKKKIDQTQKQIYIQGNYRVASVRSQMGTELLETLPIVIQISEAPRWTTRFGVGYGREDKFRAFTDIQYLSFLTKTGRLNLFAKHSGLEPYNFYLKFSQPSFLFKINTLTLNPFMQRQNEPGYKLDKIGYNITFLQNFSEELNTSIGIVYEDVELDTTNINEFELPPEEETFYEKMGVVFGGIYNNSDPVLDPVQGYSFSFNTKTNGILTKNEMPFFRILAEGKTYFGLRKGVVVALKAKIGGIKRTDGDLFIPVEERFYSGGSHSVRGWSRSDLGPKDENGTPVGGNSLFETSAEFRFDLGRRFKFSLFTDAGNVWLDSFRYHFNDLHYSAGAGISIKTPIGPAGLDFARPIFEEEKGWQIHFNIGHTF